MKIHYIQHVSFEGLGVISEWAEAGAHEMEAIQAFNGDGFPAAADVDGLIVMGGPMGVYDVDEYPWIESEKLLIRNVVEAGKPVLGVCLGAQFIASALGAKVCPGTKEIGWSLVDKVQDGRFFKGLPEELNVLHWHGDTFDLPDGAMHLAKNAVTENQAFEYKNALGLQFHFEMGAVQVEAMLENCVSDLDGGAYVQDAGALRSGAVAAEGNKKILFTLLNRLFVS